MEILILLLPFKSRFIAICLTLIPCMVFSQPTIYTPNGSLVKGLKSYQELTSSEIAASNFHHDITYPNATRIASATRTYNCHGYAWHMSSDSNEEAVWIEGGDLVPPHGMPNNEDVYWTDGSYIEICTPYRFSKVSYNISDHSAITTADASVFISKWGNGPLMQHAYNYAPYGPSITDHKYYIRMPAITGPNTFFNSATYYLPNLPPGSTVTWSASPANLVNISVTNDTSVCVTRLPNIGNALCILTAVFTTSCGSPSYTFTKQVGIGIPNTPNPAYSVTGPDQFCSNTVYAVHNVPADATLAWSYTGPGTIGISTTGNTASVSANSSGGYVLKASIIQGCTETVVTPKTIFTWLKAPDQIILQQPIRTGNFLAYIPYNSGDYSNASGFNWSLNGLSVGPGSFGSTTYRFLKLYAGVQDNYRLSVRAYGPCGFSDYTTIIFFVTLAQGYLVAIYPNPATDYITISKEELESETAEVENPEPWVKSASPSLEVKLYNLTGLLMCEGKIGPTQKEVTLNTKNLRDDNYVLHIIEGENITKKQIIVKH